MKKKVLFVLVLLTMVGASTVFGQREWKNSPNQAGHFGFGGNYVIVAAHRTNGNPNILEFLASADENAKRTEKRSPKIGERLDDNIYIHTKAGETLTLATYKDPLWYSPSADNQLWTIQPNSTVCIWKANSGHGTFTNVELFSGSVIQDKFYESKYKFEEFISFLSSVENVYGSVIRKEVDAWKSAYTKNGVLDKDGLAKNTIAKYSAGTAAVGAAWGVGGAFMIPAEFLHVYGQYSLEAAMAYALAYVYGRTSNFETDCYVLFAGESVAKRTLNTYYDMAKDGIKDFGKSAIEKAGRTVLDKVKPGLITGGIDKILESMPTGIVKGAPVVAAVIGAFVNSSDAKTFGNDAMRYYKN